MTAAKTSSSVGVSTSTDSTTTPCSSSARIAGAIAPLPAAVRSTTRVGAPGSAGSTLPRPASASRARPALLGLRELDVQRRLADARLERVRRALGDQPAGGDDADAIGELLGLLEVLGREEDGRALVVERAHLAPERAAARRVEARRRLVEEQHVRPVHEREREVQPPPHPARVAADAPVGGLRQADALEQRDRAFARGRAAQPVQRALHPQQLAPGHQRVDRGLLQRDADRAPDRVGVRDDVVPGDARGARRSGAAAS